VLVIWLFICKLAICLYIQSAFEVDSLWIFTIRSTPWLLSLLVLVVVFWLFNSTGW
jgi:hypothetical protein